MPTDEVEVLVTNVQDVSPETFSSLDAGDILFIDSTHVLKSGSDVHFELFEILPRLQAGVVIHFHDIPYPFEYPDEWIVERNYSWNEAYALHAFLAFNDSFRITLWNSFLAATKREHLDLAGSKFPENPGSGIWITRC